VNEARKTEGGAAEETPALAAASLTIGYGAKAIMGGIDFRLRRGEIFFILGGSGSGKSTLLKTLIGLIPPLEGSVSFFGEPFDEEDPRRQQALLQRTGVLYQGGALFSSMNLRENVALPLRIHTDLDEKTILALADYKLRLVELGTAGDRFPSEISGGMMKRAGLARALALDPEILFFDEPSAGLDPVTSHQLDETIRRLNRSLGTTVVVVSHELASIFALAERVVFLDAASRKQLEVGDPRRLQTDSTHASVREFLGRGLGAAASAGTRSSAP
jgi:phospholipid/cholesterol/gamma-HCH transport system ATP-binding protein